MNWKELAINMSTSNVGVTRTIKFIPIIKLPEINKITSSCGCSTPKFDKEKNELIVIFTPKKVPKHLRGKQNHYTTTKYITVSYKDGSKDVLSFTTKVIQQ